MNLWERIKCGLLGRCTYRPRHAADLLISKMDQSLADTKDIKHELREIRETGIWPQDMIRGTYRVNRRTVRREHS